METEINYERINRNLIQWIWKCHRGCTMYIEISETGKIRMATIMV